jgi:membrane-associated phospholipid phosphatase
MPDPEVQRAATYLASHAVLLLGLGIVIGIGASAGIVAAVRAVARHQRSLRRALSALVRHSRHITFIDRAMARAATRVPSGYLALHLVLGLVLTTAASVFFVIAEDVIAGGRIAMFDVAFAQALQHTATPAWERFFTVVSWFGERAWLTAGTVVVAVGLLLRRRTVLAAGWVAAQAGGGLLNMALKETFERTRPEFADPALASSSWSFPSGHTMGTFILCGLGCYLALRKSTSWTASVVIIAGALSWCLVMAFSRLYLGAHFASDVIAGVIAGAAWVTVCASAFETIRRRNVVRGV